MHEYSPSKYIKNIYYVNSISCLIPFNYIKNYKPKTKYIIRFDLILFDSILFRLSIPVVITPFVEGPISSQTHLKTRKQIVEYSYFWRLLKHRTYANHDNHIFFEKHSHVLYNFWVFIFFIPTIWIMEFNGEQNRDFYKVLGLKKECNVTELKIAYKKLALVRNSKYGLFILTHFKKIEFS